MELVKLSDVCKFQYGFAFDSKMFSEAYGVPLIRIRDIVRGYSETYTTEKCRDEYIIDDGDILVGMDGEFNVAKWRGGKAYLNQRVCKIIPNDKIDPNYLYYYLPVALKNISVKTSFVTVKHLSAKELNKMLIPFPSKQKQQKISITLDKIQKILYKQRKQLELLDKLTKSRFVEMFGGINDSRKFTYFPLKQIAKITSGGTPKRDVKEYWENGDIPWVKTTELQNCFIRDTEEHITTLGMQNSSAKMVPLGTILIAMYGQGKTRGKTGYLMQECATNQACACIIPSEKINSIYLWKYLVFSYDFIRSLAKGGNQPNLNVNIIGNISILLPPIELQNQFADFVKETDKSRQIIQASLDETQKLFDSLMQQYFG